MVLNVAPVLNWGRESGREEDGCTLWGRREDGGRKFI